MDIVIPWMVALGYCLTSIPASIYAARSHQRTTHGNSLMYSASMGMLAGAGWPIGLPYWWTVAVMQRDERRKEEQSQYRMTLETAQRIVANHEAFQRKEREHRRRKQRLDWDAKARELGLYGNPEPRRPSNHFGEYLHDKWHR